MPVQCGVPDCVACTAAQRGAERRCAAQRHKAQCGTAGQGRRNDAVRGAGGLDWDPPCGSGERRSALGGSWGLGVVHFDWTICAMEEMMAGKGYGGFLPNCTPDHSPELHPYLHMELDQYRYSRGKSENVSKIQYFSLRRIRQKSNATNQKI